MQPCGRGWSYNEYYDTKEINNKLSLNLVELIEKDACGKDFTFSDSRAFESLFMLSYMMSFNRLWSDASIRLSLINVQERYELIESLMKCFDNQLTEFGSFFNDWKNLNIKDFYPIQESFFDKLFERYIVKSRVVSDLRQRLFFSINYFLENSRFKSASQINMQRARKIDQLAETVPQRSNTVSEAINYLKISLSFFTQIYPDRNSFSAAELTDADNYIRSIVPLECVSDILNVSRTIVNSLASSNILKTIAFSKRGRDKLFSLYDVAGFLNKIGMQCDFNSEANTKDLICYDKIINNKLQFKTRGLYITLITDVLKGLLKVQNFEIENGLKGIYFLRNDVERYVNSGKLINNDLFDLKEAAQFIGTYRDAMHRIISTGLIPVSSQSAHVFNSKKLVKKTDLESFSKIYMLPKQIAEYYDCNVTNVSDKLKSMGVCPVSGPFIDNGLIYIFRRSDIESITKESFNKVKKYNSNSGRRRKGDESLRVLASLNLIDANKACEIIGSGINVQTIASLVRKGYIKDYVHNGELGNKKFFEPVEIENYLDKYKNNSNLLSYNNACALLNLTERRFFIDWIKPKRLEYIDDGLGNKFFRLEDLKKVQDFRLNNVSLYELIALTGKTKADISNAVKLGKIKPVSGPAIDGFSNFMFSRKVADFLLQ